MATPKTEQKALIMCKKCGSPMITRMIVEKNGETKTIIRTQMKFIKIHQCIVCRHWAPII